jgi:hypothetical protein
MSLFLPTTNCDCTGSCRGTVGELCELSQTKKARAWLTPSPGLSLYTERYAVVAMCAPPT